MLFKPCKLIDDLVFLSAWMNSTNLIFLRNLNSNKSSYNRLNSNLNSNQNRSSLQACYKPHQYWRRLKTNMWNQGRVANRPGMPGTVPELTSGVPCPVSQTGPHLSRNLLTTIGVARGAQGARAPPNWNATNNKNVTKKTIVSFVSVSFSNFAHKSTRIQQ